MMGRFETLDVMWVREGQLHLPLAIAALALAVIGVVGGWMIAQGRDIRLPGALGRQVSSHWQIVLLLAVTLYPFLSDDEVKNISLNHFLSEEEGKKRGLESLRVPEKLRDWCQEIFGKYSEKDPATMGALYGSTRTGS